METQIFELKRVATSVTLSVPVFYLIGYFYSVGYLGEFGLNEEYFPITIQDYLVMSFFVFMKVITTILTSAREKYWVVAIAAIVVGVIVLLAVHIGKNYEFTESRAKSFRSYKYFDYLFYPFMSTIFTLVAPYAFVSFLFTLALIPAAAYVQGGHSAKEYKNDFNGCRLDKMMDNKSCVYLKGGERHESGMFIANSDSHIAIWNGVSTEVINTDGMEIEIKFGQVAPGE